MSKSKITVLHRRLKQLRKKAKKSQDDVAEVVGLHKTAVSHWENGHSAPRSGHLEKLAAFFGVKVADLFREAA